MSSLKPYCARGGRNIQQQNMKTYKNEREHKEDPKGEHELFQALLFFISHMFSNTSSELLTGFTTQQHPIAILVIFLCGFDRKFRRHFFGSMGGDDRTKGDGFKRRIGRDSGRAKCVTTS